MSYPDPDSELRDRVEQLENLVAKLLDGERVHARKRYGWSGEEPCPGGDGVVTSVEGLSLAIRLDDGMEIRRHISEVEAQ